MRFSASLLAIPLCAAAMIAGCGGDDDSSDSSSSDSSANTTQTQPSGDAASSGGGGTTLALAADPSGALAYDTDTLSAPAGTVDVEFTNDSPVGHDVVFERDGEEVAASSVLTGGSEAVSFDAKPGDYTFYCSLPGHEEAGMKGSLTVK